MSSDSLRVCAFIVPARKELEFSRNESLYFESRSLHSLQSLSIVQVEEKGEILSGVGYEEPAGASYVGSSLLWVGFYMNWN